ncbi:uncharacterized protein LOC115318349 [Ixodes scapularis]|uniref:uncharacterized protein LOC115318349 n=1 Tax=Ixodes scapularis TaxID=6945 RepID=UPI001A9F7C4F|nr:uncharacterized protein LOC115318349 [Ixodes scapularis]
MNDACSSDRVPVALPLTSIDRYVNKACDTSRCLNEADDVYYAGHVVESAVKTVHDCVFTFLAFVLQTTALGSAPHEVRITVKMSEVDQASCSCKAGNYKCKHIVAVLLHINPERTFEQLSSTDQDEPRIMIDLFCAKKVKIKEVPQLQGNILQRLLKNVGHRSAAKMHLEPAVETAMKTSMDPDTVSEPAPRDLTLMGCLDELRRLAGSRDSGLPLDEVLKHLHESKSSKDLKDIELATRDQAKSGLWMRTRVGMITAFFSYSVFTRVKTLQTKMGPHDLRPLLRKLMRQTYVRTPAMSRESALEGPAKECYKTKQAQHQNLVLSQCGLYNMQGRPYIGASPDALVECQCCEKRVLEAKCPESMVKFLGEITEKSVGDMPSMKLKHTTTVFCQVQVQMGLTGCNHADLFVYIEEQQNECIRVEFDEDYFNDVVERASCRASTFHLIFCVIT